MIKTIRENYLLKKTQILVLDKNGVVNESDNLLFFVENGALITAVHPFFETVILLLTEENSEHNFNCIHLEIGAIKGIYDIVFNSGSDVESPFIIFFDFTEHYNSFQSIAQEKNETVFSFYDEVSKNKQLKIEKEFKNQFLANISHDLRTPVAASLNFLELLDSSNLNSDQKGILKTILQTNVHINGLVDDLLEISRIETGEFSLNEKSFSFDDLVEQIERIYLFNTAQKNIDFEIEIDQKIPRNLIGDRVRILQIIVNLLDNSVKFTNHGVIKIKISENYRRADNLGICIEVIDTGIGISSRNTDRVLESFVKLQDENNDGLGLGLSIVVKIATLLKGVVKLKSVLKQGTTVEVTIPLKIDMNISLLKSKLKKSYFEPIALTKKYNILVVEDNEVNQLLLMKVLLNHEGFYVDIAENGQQAYDFVTSNDYDLVLMDIEMPKMGGILASKMIRNNPNSKIAKLPIIAVTAYPSKEIIEKTKAIKINDFLARPFTRAELFSSIYKALKIKSPK
jgi:two-component system, sensor histidine kinase